MSAHFSPGARQSHGQGGSGNAIWDLVSAARGNLVVAADRACATPFPAACAGDSGFDSDLLATIEKELAAGYQRHQASSASRLDVEVF